MSTSRVESGNAGSRSDVDTEKGVFPGMRRMRDITVVGRYGKEKGR